MSFYVDKTFVSFIDVVRLKLGHLWVAHKGVSCLALLAVLAIDLGQGNEDVFVVFRGQSATDVWRQAPHLRRDSLRRNHRSICEPLLGRITIRVFKPVPAPEWLLIQSLLKHNLPHLQGQRRPAII